MNRLTHSDKGFIRSLQISRGQLFVFVEGGLDRPFADRLIGLAFPNKTWQHQVIGMKEFPSNTGGKAALLTLFQLMRKRRQLDHVAFGKKMVCAFFADKDIDDLTRRRVRSAHFIYTQTYDLEGHLFQSGSLTEAVSDACLVTAQQATALIGNPSAWIRRHATNWKDWLVLCIISHKNNLNTGCSYSRPSNVNQNYLNPTDPTALQLHITTLQQALNISSTQFGRMFRSIESTVLNSLNSTNPLQYFKGKWLQLLLEKYLDAAPAIPDSNFKGASDRIASTLVAQTGTRTPCRLCDPFIGEIQRLGALLA
jgi:hypothetical protein